MNLRDLQNINLEDLKGIDWQQVSVRALKKPELLINSALVLITIVFGIMTCQSTLQKTTGFKADMGKYAERYETLQGVEAIRKDQNDFLKGAPKAISVNRLIETLSETALKHDIQISSFSPSEVTMNTYVRLTKVRIKIQSEDYADIVRFVYDIENSEYSVRIGKLEATLSKSAGQNQQWSFASGNDLAPRREYIEADIEIESVELKNE